MQKTLNYSIHSSKKHRQHESNKVNNTATKHSLYPGNGVWYRSKTGLTAICPREMHHIICNLVRLVRSCFNNNKKTRH